jgi:hypothetical protein
METLREVRSFRVWIKSVPGFYAQYDGYVDVYADDQDEAVDLAFIKLKHGSFPDRDRSMWRVVKVEVM